MAPAVREAWARAVIAFLNRHYEPGTEFFRPETKSKFRLVSPARDQISKIVRRTGRANAACSRKVSVIRDSGNCVVADAVQVEPVSTPKFPANREINREFCRLRSDVEI
jgi:ketosteroid isomerase-like protein